MEKLNVAVIFGGHSSEHEVSKASAAAILAAMDEKKYNIIPVYITIDGKWFLYDGAVESMKGVQLDRFGTSAVLSPDRENKCLLRIVGDRVKRLPVDVAFPVLHGLNGEDGTIQGLFEMAGIPYVGCGVLSSALCMDKCYTKLVAESLSISQAEYLTFTNEDLNDMDQVAKTIRYKIGYPCFVKPANTGSSVGITKAKNKKSLITALELAARHDNKILVEKAVKGRECECAVLGAGYGDAQASPVGEIVPGDEFYTYDAKYHNNDSKTLVPADIPQSISDEIRDVSVKIFGAMGCSGLARVDFFVEDGTERVIFNEINTMPGFTAISMYPMMWNEAGVPTPELIDRLIEIGLRREC